MLALMMVEQYVRSAVRSGSRIRTVVEKVLKHIVHSWIDDMYILGCALSFTKRSKKVGSGAPSCDGSKSRKSINSFL